MAARKKAKGFNLAALDTLQNSVSGVDLIIKNPFDDNNPIGDKGAYLAMKVLGPASSQYRKAQNKIMRDLLSRKKDPSAMDASDIVTDDAYDQNNLDVVVSCVVGWSNMYFDPSNDDVTTALEFNQKNLEMVLIHCPWIRRQLESHIIDERNFLKG